MDEITRITEALAAFFDPSEVKWKPQSVKDARALAIAYVDARVVQDRLDEVLGIDGWQDEYKALEQGSVTCTLRVRLGGEWVTKEDVGSESEQTDGGDRMKAAFSDALKRAAVKFGVGRYLYRLPHQWVDYDPQKRRFAREPQLPDWARPAANAPAQSPAPPTPAPARPAATQPAEAGGPPANGQAPAGIDDHQHSALLGLMSAKGSNWIKVANFIGVHPTSDSKKLSRARYDAAIDYLNKLPNKPTAPVITEAQAVELKELLTRAKDKLPWSKFASYYGIQKLTQLPADSFAAAREDLLAGLETAAAPVG